MDALLEHEPCYAWDWTATRRDRARRPAGGCRRSPGSPAPATTCWSDGVLHRLGDPNGVGCDDERTPSSTTLGGVPRVARERRSYRDGRDAMRRRRRRRRCGRSAGASSWCCGARRRAGRSRASLRRGVARPTSPSSCASATTGRPDHRQPVGGDRRQRLVGRDGPVRHAAEVRHRGPVARRRASPTGCEPNGDSTVWTCTLRDGLKWSDGTPLTSRDVAFTLPLRDRQQDAAVPELLPVQPDVRDPRRPDADLEVRASRRSRPTCRRGSTSCPRRCGRASTARDSGDQGTAEHPVDRRADRSSSPSWNAGAGLDDGAEPVLLGRRADGRPDRVPRVLEPGGDDPGAAERRDRLRRRRSAVAREDASRASTT